MSNESWESHPICASPVEVLLALAWGDSRTWVAVDLPAEGIRIGRFTAAPMPGRVEEWRARQGDSNTGHPIVRRPEAALAALSKLPPEEVQGAEARRAAAAREWEIVSAQPDSAFAWE